MSKKKHNKEAKDIFTAKNGVAYTHMAFVLLTQFPNVTPKQFETMLEVMQDWGLLSENGDMVKHWIHNAVWKD